MATATALAERVRFRVYSIPATQGSLRAFLPPGRRAPVVVHDNKPALRSWRDAVASEALRAGRLLRDSEHAGLLEGALAVTLRFHLPRPKTMPAQLRTAKQQERWAWPWRGRDLDKYVRAALDAMTGILFLDDAQIVRIEASKEYSTRPGVEITVEQFS